MPDQKNSAPTAESADEPPLVRKAPAWKAMLLLLVFLASAAPSVRGSGLQQEMESLVATALAAHPRIEAAGAEAEQARQGRAAAEGFRDPLWSVSAGRTEQIRSLSGVPVIEGLPGRAAVLQASVERPLWPGVYAQAGWSERRLFDPPGADESLYQSILGLRLRVPLWRDRGFRQWRLETEALDAAGRAGDEAFQEERQRLRHDVESRYLAWIAAVNVRRAADEAAEQFEALLRDAQERARLQALPAYQIEPARMEWELRREEALAAEDEESTALLLLHELTGPFEQRADAGGLVSWALAAALPRVDQTAAPEALGAYRRLLALREGARALGRAAEDAFRPDLSLEARATGQTEDPGRPFGSDALLEEDRFGGEVLLVYRRHGRRSAQKAARAQAAALEAAAEAGLKAFRLQHAAALAAAQSAFARAKERLDVVTRAAGAAAATVEGERDRFRLGEGGSRALLDAQKDLTTTILRQARIAADLLQARADVLYATGYPDSNEMQHTKEAHRGPGR